MTLSSFFRLFIALAIPCAASSAAEEWELSSNFGLCIGRPGDHGEILRNIAQKEEFILRLIDPTFPNSKRDNHNRLDPYNNLEISFPYKGRMRLSAKIAACILYPTFEQWGYLGEKKVPNDVYQTLEMETGYLAIMAGGSYVLAEYGDFDLRCFLSGGPLFGKTQIKRILDITDPSGTNTYSNSMRMQGFGMAAVAGTEIGWIVAKHVSLFLEIAYHYAAVEKMKMIGGSWFDLDSEGVTYKSGDVFKGPDGEPYRFDYSGVRFAFGTRWRFKSGSFL